MTHLPPYEELSTWTRSQYRALGSDKEALTTIVNLAGNPRWLVKELRRILQDSDYIEQIARASFKHPLGAAKIVLAPTSYQDAEMRLHLWFAELQTTHSPHVHNHRWNYGSKILAGRFCHTTFNADPTRASHVSYELVSPGPGKSYEIVSTGSCGLTETESRVLCVNDAYHLEKNALHNLVPESGAAAITLVARGPYETDRSIAVVPQGEPVGSSETSARPLLSDDVKKYLLFAISVLEV